MSSATDQPKMKFRLLAGGHVEGRGVNRKMYTAGAIIETAYDLTRLNAKDPTIPPKFVRVDEDEPMKQSKGRADRQDGETDAAYAERLREIIVELQAKKEDDEDEVDQDDEDEDQEEEQDD